MGGTTGKVSTETGSTGPGLLPFPRVKRGCNLPAQVIKDSLVGRTGTLDTYRHTYRISSLSALFFLFFLASLCPWLGNKSWSQILQKVPIFLSRVERRAILVSFPSVF